MKRPSYEEIIIPNLKKIEKMINDGLPQYEIHQALGISRPTWNKWKESHEELRCLLYGNKTRQEAIEERVANVKDALYKRATGITYEETRTYQAIDANGNTTSHTEKTVKYIPPDATCIFGFLNYYDKGYIKDKAQYDLRKKEVEIKAEELELKKQAANLEDTEDTNITINIVRKDDGE